MYPKLRGVSDEVYFQYLSKCFSDERPVKVSWFWAVIGAGLGLLLILGCDAPLAHAEVISPDALANAIYKAEGSVKFPYGIKSIDTHGDKVYARKICLNTIRNHMRRHNGHKCGKDFITCLGDRFCPPSAHSLNRNWVKNVKYYYQKGV